MLIAIGLRKAPTAHDLAPIAKDDFIARYGLSYGESADLVSGEARVEIERQKNFRHTRRH